MVRTRSAQTPAALTTALVAMVNSIAVGRR
jgi:hypothetical protein